MVELTTGIHQNVSTLRQELYAQRALLAHLVREDNVLLLSAGLHPISVWQDQLVTVNERYYAIEDDQREIARSSVYFGLHVHIGIQDQETIIALMNQVRTWLPHLLALSANSPFSEGRLTGFKAYRPILRARAFMRQGIPSIYPSWADFERYMHDLTVAGLIKGCRDIWWDVRPHLIYNTIEFRICDMPLTLKIRYRLQLSAKPLSPNSLGCIAREKVHPFSHGSILRKTSGGQPVMAWPQP